MPASASLGQADAQRLLQLHFRRTDTLSSTRFPPKSECPASRGDLEPALALRRAFLGRSGLPLSKKDREGCEP